MQNETDVDRLTRLMMQRNEANLISEDDFCRCYRSFWDMEPRKEWTTRDLVRIIAEFIVRDSSAGRILRMTKDSILLLLSLLGLALSGTKPTLAERLNDFACTEKSRESVPNDESVMLLVDHIDDLEVFKFDCFASKHDVQDLGFFSRNLYNHLLQRNVDDFLATELVRIVTPSVRLPLCYRSQRHQDSYLSWSKAEKLAFFSKRFVLFALLNHEDEFIPELIMPELKRIMEIMKLSLEGLKYKADIQGALRNFVFSSIDPPKLPSEDQEINLFYAPIKQLRMKIISNLKKALITPGDQRLELFAISIDLFPPVPPPHHAWRSFYSAFASSAVYFYLNIDGFELAQVKAFLSIFGFPTSGTLKQLKDISKSFFASDSGDVEGIELDLVTTKKIKTFNEFKSSLQHYVMVNKLPLCGVEGMNEILTDICTKYLLNSFGLPGLDAPSWDILYSFGIYSLPPSSTGEERLRELKTLLRRVEKQLVATTEKKNTIAPFAFLSISAENLQAVNSPMQQSASNVERKDNVVKSSPSFSFPSFDFDSKTQSSTNSNATNRQLSSPLVPFSSAAFPPLPSLNGENDSMKIEAIGKSASTSTAFFDFNMPGTPSWVNSSPSSLPISSPSQAINPLSQSPVQPKRDVSKFMETLKSSVESSGTQTRKKCWEDIFVGQDSVRCPICSYSEIKYSGNTFDECHIIPKISGGSQYSWNLIPGCGCNQNMGKKHLIDWMGTDGNKRMLLKPLFLKKYKAVIPPIYRSKTDEDQVITFVSKLYDPPELSVYSDWLCLTEDELLSIHKMT